MIYERVEVSTLCGCFKSLLEIFQLLHVINLYNLKTQKKSKALNHADFILDYCVIIISKKRLQFVNFCNIDRIDIYDRS